MNEQWHQETLVKKSVIEDYINDANMSKHQENGRTTTSTELLFSAT